MVSLVGVGERLLAGFDRRELDGIPDVACAVRVEDWAIAYVNSAWLSFAKHYGASRPWGVGDSLIAAIAEPLRDFYAAHLATVAATGVPWEHDYECSSAELHREFHLRALAVGDGAGVLMAHSLRVEHAHVDRGARLTPAELAHLYEGNGRIVAQCGHCRRVRRVRAPRTWDWVPQLVAHAHERTTHGLCEMCLAYYFAPGALETARKSV